MVGYRHVRKLPSGRRFTVVRADRASDGHPVVLKAAKAGVSGGLELLLHEDMLLRRLAGRGIAGTLGVVRVDDQAALILEDAGAQTLGDLVHQRRRLNVEEFLELALAITKAVARLHEHKVIHKDLNPSNIVLDDELRPTLIDFEIATSVAAPAQIVSLPQELAGTLAYVAPEQTGRLDRSLDHRADLYSLGAIFYEMLTGAPPFRAASSAELLHLHLAKAPLPPAQVAPSIPPLLSDLVLKLLAKMPEERYQSAEAVEADLLEARRRCAGEAAIEPFELGRLDLVRMLPFPERMYGRARERAALGKTLECVEAGGRELVFVSGVAGIGKTMLVDDLRARFGGAGRIMSAKCDQLWTEVPYGAFAEASRQIVRALTAEPPEALAEWRRRLLEALAPNVRVLVDVIPELARVVGEVPPAPVLGPVETEHRFRFTFQAFLRQLAHANAPLMIVLDDLQWADTASLHLIRGIALDPALSHLLVVGVYRSEEVGEDHPLRRELEALRDAGAPIHALQLEALTAETLTLLVSDTLRCSIEAARPLAELAIRKTAGNPFFVKWLLRHVQKAGLLAFDPATGQWRWDLQQLEEISVTENVGELLTGAARGLPTDTRETLEAAACIGHHAPLELLARVMDRSVDAVGSSLWPALHEGLLVPVRAPEGAMYAFAHDRVQQAAYALLDDAQRQALHRRIGRALLSALSPGELENRLFEVVDQLNAGVVQDPSERLELARLDMRAGRKALASAAFEPALAYFRRALVLLPGDDASGARLEAYRGAAECAFLTGDVKLGDELAAHALELVPSLPERATLYGLHVMDRSLRGEFAEAFHWGKTGLALFGVTLPTEQVQAAIDAKLAEVAALIGGRSSDELLLLPEARDENEIAVMQLLGDLIPTFYFSDLQLFAYTNLEVTARALRHGLTAGAAVGISGYAMTLARLGAYAEAYAIGRLAIDIARRFHDPSQEARTQHIFNSFLNQWQARMRDVVAAYKHTFARCMETGNLAFAAYVKIQELAQLYAMGVDLDFVGSAAKSTLRFSREIASQPAIRTTLAYRQAARCLKAYTARASSFDDADFDEATFLHGPQDEFSLASYWVMRLQVAYVMRDLDRALAAKRTAEPRIPFAGATYAEAFFVFYGALALLAKGELAEARPLERRLATWARACPPNFQHQHELVLGEIARVEGRAVDAIAHYERAYEGAALEGFVQDEALAHECCGRLFVSLNAPLHAQEHLDAARRSYDRWGATAKVAALDQEFTELLARAAADRTLTSRPDAGMELVSLFKALEAMSGELELTRLCELLIEHGLRLAGAQRAALVLDDRGTLVVRARGAVAEPAALEQTPLAESDAVTRAIVERVHDTGGLVVAADAEHDERFSSDAHVAAARVKSVLALPITRKSGKLGVLYFENSLTTHSFTPERIQNLKFLASELAGKLDNSFLFGRLRVEVRERTRAEEAMRFLAEVSRSLAETLDFKKIVAQVARLATIPLADWCTVNVVNDAHEVTALAFAARDPAKEALLAELYERYPPKWGSNLPGPRVIRSGESILVPLVDEAMVNDYTYNAEHANIVRALGITTAMAVPLAARGRTFGAVSFVGVGRERRYGPEDLALAQELARRAAVAIDNAWLYHEAQEAIRMRDEFIAVASHELRTPLTPVILGLQLLKKQIDGGATAGIPAPLVRLVERTDVQLDGLRRLVESLLDTSRVSSGDIALALEDVDVTNLVRTVVERHAIELERAGSAIELRLSPAVRLRCDPIRIEQVITNLLGNALKYGARKPIEIELTQGGAVVRVLVRDHGIGIAKEQQAWIFERFARAVSVQKYGGFGLGLYIAKKIVQAHGGSIRVESEPGEGTAFTLELPLREQGA